MKLSDPKPEIQRLEQLVTSIRSGEIRLPKFQRPFVWSRTDMLDLLDSIYNGYPIGSILLWHSSERLKSERAIIGFEVNTTSIDNYPTNYLLDGQQRLTTLCGALFWEGNDPASMWQIYFDLESEQFTYAKGPIGVNLFPLNRLIKTSDFIKQCMKFEQAGNPKRYYETAEKLLQSIKDYKIAVVRIGDIALDEVAPIFERINSTGRKLTMVDLMRAATWKDGFDLTVAIDEIIHAIDDAGYGEIADTNVLRSISAAAGFGVNKDDIDKLRGCSALELRAATNAAKNGILAALEFLRSIANMDDLTFLPYGLQLAHLAEFFQLKPNPTDIERRVLSEWFWSTCAIRHFAGASTGQNAKDLADIRAFANGETDNFNFPDVLDISQFLFDQFNLRNASSTAFALLLKAQRPTSTIYGRSFDETHVKEKERHVFENLLHEDALLGNRNICQVLNPFKGTDKNSVLSAFSERLFMPHLLDESCVEAIAHSNFENLFVSRAELVSELLAKLTGRVTTFEFRE